LLGSPEYRQLELVELQELDNKLLQKSCYIEERLMPKIPVWSTVITDDTKKNATNEMEALLTADLLENKRLSTETFIELQNNDSKIKIIKENLLGNPEAFDTFTIKNGILCKKFCNKKDGMVFLGPYIPTGQNFKSGSSIHRRDLHPSTSQTIKEFKAYYYHPTADRIIKELCRNCIICTQTRNKEKRNIGVGRQRTLKGHSMPSQPLFEKNGSHRLRI
jgi:Integrase zinc binding domain